ncbi:hypothetical protein PsYK624_171620 [Phanerochaete sordida]|uniref:Uncharacterized protein n=1 Tax=Phanerochaete sordida TaxID=48140 RepID=A0A9P3GUX1_9APHY|nr:hypothetical protein PsYK624_171620 [Phanerochaete sordida]
MRCVFRAGCTRLVADAPCVVGLLRPARRRRDRGKSRNGDGDGSCVPSLTWPPDAARRTAIRRVGAVKAGTSARRPRDGEIRRRSWRARWRRTDDPRRSSGPAGRLTCAHDSLRGGRVAGTPKIESARRGARPHGAASPAPSEPRRRLCELRHAPPRRSTKPFRANPAWRVGGGGMFARGGRPAKASRGILSSRPPGPDWAACSVVLWTSSALVPPPASRPRPPAAARTLVDGLTPRPPPPPSDTSASRGRVCAACAQALDASPDGFLGGAGESWRDEATAG